MARSGKSVPFVGSREQRNRGFVMITLCAFCLGVGCGYAVFVRPVRIEYLSYTGKMPETSETSKNAQAGESEPEVCEGEWWKHGKPNPLGECS